MGYPKHRTIRTCLRKLTAIVLLAVVATGGLGIPLFSFVAKDKSQPFPCQDSPCACRDAETCWRGCCCMNDQQKLAWAAQAGVTPPDFVLARLKNQTPSGREQVARGTADSADSAACDSCCQTPSAASQTTPVQARNEAPNSELRLVLLSAQARCQGYVDWLTLFSSALLLDVDSYENLSSGLSHPVSEVAGIYQTCALHPPVPPPRAV